MKFNLSRREVLIGCGAVGVMGATGAGWLAFADHKQALLAYFKRALPGVAIDDETALVCIDEFLSRWSWKERRAVSVAWRTFGVETMGDMSERFELAARRALTMYLTDSNFFHASDPHAIKIVYSSRPPGTACSNPFANLEPPAAEA